MRLAPSRASRLPPRLPGVGRTIATAVEPLRYPTAAESVSLHQALDAFERQHQAKRHTDFEQILFALCRFGQLT